MDTVHNKDEHGDYSAQIGQTQKTAVLMKRGQRREYVCEMLLHEHRLLLRKCHVHIPELVKEVLVSGDKVRKRLY